MRFIKTKLGKTLTILTAISVTIFAVNLVYIIKINNLNENLTNENTTYKTQNDILEQKINELGDEIENNKVVIDNYTNQLEDYKTDFETLKSQKGTLVYLGTFTITHYCCEQYPHICGNGDGLTASGAKVRTGTTIAVDRKKIPLGTKVYIQGYGLRIAQDVGGGVKGNQIDVAVKTHAEAMRLGKVKKEVWAIM